MKTYNLKKRTTRKHRPYFCKTFGQQPPQNSMFAEMPLMSTAKSAPHETAWTSILFFIRPTFTGTGLLLARDFTCFINERNKDSRSRR